MGIHVAYDEKLAERIRRDLAHRSGVTERKMFGGIAFMLNGNICCGIVGSDLMVRVGKDAHAGALAQPGARPMTFTGRSMKGFVYVDGAVLTPARLHRWVARGVAYADTLPHK